MSNEFPAFIKAEYVEGDAFSRFQRDLQQATDGFKRKFAEAGQEAQRVLGQAMSLPRASSGSLDLGVPQLRVAAAAQEARAAAAREVAAATAAAAKAEGDYSSQARAAVTATQALAIQEEKAAAAARSHAVAAEQVQKVLSRRGTASSAPALSPDGLIGAASRLRAEIDPMFAAQQRFNTALDQAETLFSAGVISVREYGQAQQIARQQLQEHADSLDQTKQKAQQAAAELLALRQAEAGAAEGARILAAAYQGTALEAGRATKSARESASAFEAVFQVQERAAAEMLALQRAEAGAADGARLLTAALQGTALAADRTTKSARESASVFEAAFAAQERAANEAAAAQKALAASAAQLRAELDPMFAAQQRFNTALDRAEELFRAGTISTREYEQAQAQARQQLQAHAQSLFVVENAQGRGTSATRINTESQRANRFAMIQAGQQLQDITISLQSGQRATTVFAQQLPQLAFAFTDVGGKVGAFAQFLAGPWGVAVFGAVTALGFFIEHLFSAGKASDDLGRSSLSLSQALEKETFATNEGLQALKDYNAEKERARAADALAIDDSIRKQKARLNEALATREALKAELERYTASLQFGDASGSFGAAGQALVIGGVESGIAAQQTRIDNLNKALSNLGIDKATQDAKALADPIEAINQRYDRMTDFAKRAASANKLLAGTLRDTLAGLEKQRQSEIDATRERERAAKGRGPGDPGETTRFLSPIAGTQSAPFGQQRGNRRHAGIDIAAPVGTAVRAPADGTIIEIGNDPGGYGNYVIIDHGRGTKTRYAHLLQTTRSKGSSVAAGDVFARSGGAPGAPGSGNSRGAHLHYEVLRNGKAVDPMKGLFPTDSLNVAREAEQALEQIAGRVQNLQDRFDPATKAANDFAEALRTIREAQGAGIISESQSFDLQIDAMAQQAGALVRIQNEAAERFMKVFEPQQMRSAAEEWSDVVEDRWAASQRNAANEFVQAVQAADLIAALFSGRAGPQDLLRLINPNDPRMFTGASAKRSNPNERDVLGQFLFGKTSNFRELAEGKSPIQGGFAQEYTKVFSGLKDALSGSLEKVLGKDASKIGSVFGKVFAGAEVGSMTHDLIEGFGIKTSKLGSQIGGALGSAFGPIGSLIGAIVVGAGVEALKPAKRGSATIGGSNGNLIVSSTRGNSKGRVEKSVETADEAITTLQRIAEALGARLDTTKGAVSIGIRGDSFRVDTSGKGITKTKRGAVDFGDDSAAAIKFATMDLIKDGVIQGLRASTQRVLQSSKDLETAIQRAVDFEGVFQQLRERKDPIGAAIDTVEKEFTRLRDIFAQAGANAEEYASLEELYGLKRKEAIEQSAQQAFGSLKALLDDLKFGDNGRSLRDRLAAAQANFDPLSARVQAGDLSAYDDFADAARALLDIQRQFSGSQTAFFDLQDKITAITAKAVEGGNVTSILSAGSIPSAQADAQRSLDSAPIVNAIDQLGDRLVQVLGGELREINGNTSGGGGGGVTVPGFFAQNVRQI